ncbi:MAG: hypothetical protein F4177_04885, partial [Chloroflexi bacterium]|nr:hypothetical protein [Chloroflexota bacterium]
MVSDSRPVPPDPLDDAPPLFDLAALEEGQPPLDSETLARVSEALAEVEGRTERGWLSDWPAGPTDTAPPPLTLEPPPPLESLLDPEDDLPTTQPRR